MSLRILVINEQAEGLLPILSRLAINRARSLQFVLKSDGINAIRDGVEEYPVVVIDASDDVAIGNHQSVSEYIKARNPDVLMIGTSVDPALLKLRRERYDERIKMGSHYFPIRLLEILVKRGLVPEGALSK